MFNNADGILKKILLRLPFFYETEMRAPPCLQLGTRLLSNSDTYRPRRKTHWLMPIIKK